MQQDGKTTGELHGAEGGCKPPLSGSTPALVSTTPLPRGHVQVLYKRFGASSPQFDDMGQALHRWYISAGFAALEMSQITLLCKWLHVQLACTRDALRQLSIENSKLKRDIERLRRGKA